MPPDSDTLAWPGSPVLLPTTDYRIRSSSTCGAREGECASACTAHSPGSTTGLIFPVLLIIFINLTNSYYCLAAKKCGCSTHVLLPRGTFQAFSQGFSFITPQLHLQLQRRVVMQRRRRGPAPASPSEALWQRLHPCSLA